MIQFQKITESDEFDFMKTLIQDSFPVNEYRDLDEFEKVWKTNNKFNAELIIEDNKPVGILNWWNLDGIRYIEHFAIISSKRGGGIGTEAISEFLKRCEAPVVLECELPEDETQIKRVAFYKKAGLTAWKDSQYLQPPYRRGDNWFPLMLMASQGFNEHENFDSTKRLIHAIVYNAV